jgi:hypothetical protein
MFTKSACLVIVISLFGLANSLSGATWTNDDPADDSWCTPGNGDTLAGQWRNACK